MRLPRTQGDLRWFVVLALFAMLAVAWTWPLVTRLGSRIALIDELRTFGPSGARSALDGRILIGHVERQRVNADIWATILA